MQWELQGSFQGEFVPVPLDDFDEAHTNGETVNQRQWVCRAASGSEVHFTTDHAWCARDHSHQPWMAFGDNLSSLHEGDISCTNPHGADAQGDHVTILTSEPSIQPSGHDKLKPSDYLSIKGGAYPSGNTELPRTGLQPMEHEYASTTDCILQNLSMTVGNPSAYCYANAPWRAFSWTCALLQETSTQPWGTLQEAVQESLDTAETVDLHQLPGMQELWTQHDLNLQGDANHFVNSLWLQSQTRAFHFRYAEIKEQGYLVDHVQMPILIPYPDDWPEDTRFQDLINNWANQGLGQYLMDDKKVLICRVTRNTVVDGIATKHAKTLNPYGSLANRSNRAPGAGLVEHLPAPEH